MEEEKFAVMDVREMALKCTTKAEVYKVLVTSGGIYLPSVDQINGDFIRDILTGDKLYVECNKVKIIEAPHIDGLRIPELLEFAEKHCAIKRYMPDYQCEKYPSRKWICNVINSLIPEKFQKFIKEKLIESNEKIDVKKGNKFSVLPALAKVFEETNFVSRRRGRFHQLIKNSKKRRADRNNELEKEKKNQEISDYMQQQAEDIEHLQEQLDECKQKLEDHSKDTDLLKKLYDRGYIDLNGDPTNKYNDMN